ncbi:WbqC family protein [Micromonospora rhizosphaerae]|nr:WbqC family protein [Micromonospora rhizosphaerae]
MILQPTYWARCHFWNRYLNADVFVWLDHVQFARSRTKWEDRTVVESRAGEPICLRLPLRGTRNVPWRDAGLNDGWRKHGLTMRHCYGKAIGWHELEPAMDAVYGSEVSRIEEVCWRSFEQVTKLFGNPTRVVRSSTLNPVSAKGELMLELVQRVGGTRYVTGEPGATYLDQEAFRRAGVEIEIQRWTAPRTGRGLSNPSVVHLIAEHGAAAAVKMLRAA